MDSTAKEVINHSSTAKIQPIYFLTKIFLIFFSLNILHHIDQTVVYKITRDKNR